MLTVLLTAALASVDGGVGLSVEFAPGAFDDTAQPTATAPVAPKPAPAATTTPAPPPATTTATPPPAKPAPAATPPPAASTTTPATTTTASPPSTTPPPVETTVAPAPPPVPLVTATPEPDAGVPEEEVHAAEAVDAGVDEEPEPPSKVTIRGAAEGAVEVLPSGFGAMGLDGFATLRPVLGFAVDDDFAIELGPTFRLRVVDTAPDNRTSDIGGVLRRADWDEASDFMQIIQSLRIAPDTSPFFVRAGAMRKKTLGLGHLVNRYSSQENADYHPASVGAVLVLGPVRSEFFASDFLFGRILSGDVAVDLGAIFSSKTENKDRYLVSLELATDSAKSGLPFRPDPTVAPLALTPVTLLHVDGSAVLLRNATLRLMVLLGLGTRITQRADLGFVLGGAMDATVKEVGISLKLEARKQGGGFRQGFFGPNYELQRYADVGFSGASIADALLPDAFSFYGELKLGVGTAASVEVAAEYFTFGRTDLDMSANVNLIDSWLVGQARFTAVGMGQAGRYHTTVGVRARIFKSFYVMANGGTVFFPQVDGTLMRGVTASAGVGVDFER